MLKKKGEGLGLCGLSAGIGELTKYNLVSSGGSLKKSCFFSFRKLSLSSLLWFLSLWLSCGVSWIKCLLLETDGPGFASHSFVAVCPGWVIASLCLSFLNCEMMIAVYCSLDYWQD